MLENNKTMSSPSPPPSPPPPQKNEFHLQAAVNGHTSSYHTFVRNKLSKLPSFSKFPSFLELWLASYWRHM